MPVNAMKASALAAAFALVAVSPALAKKGPLDSYCATLSARDHFNSNGQRLTTAAAIIRQDRANVHRHVHTDEEDGIDTLFTTPEAREQLGQMSVEVVGGKKAEARILKGTPLVEVRVVGRSLQVEVITD